MDYFKNIWLKYILKNYRKYKNETLIFKSM